MKAKLFVAFLFMVVAMLWNEAACAGAPAEGYARPKAIIKAAELKQLLDEKAKVKIVDVRSPEAWREGHIPGAIQIARKEFEDPDGKVEALMSTPEQMNRLLSRRGIANGDDIVVYSSARSPQMAARFWWVMNVYGHKNVRVLDGNYEIWAGAGLPIETGDAAALPETEYKVGPADVAQIASLEDVKGFQIPPGVLLDVRTDGEYTGETVSSGAGRGGRIPNSVHVFFMKALDERGFFRPAGELRELYEAAGATHDKDIVIYCMRAHRASHTMFVLRELLGYPKLRVYDGSWIEWSNVEGLPIEKD